MIIVIGHRVLTLGWRAKRTRGQKKLKIW
jgi:hypothetical protein